MPLCTGPEASAGQRWHTFTLPAAGQPWHWAFTSCAAFSSGPMLHYTLYQWNARCLVKPEHTHYITVQSCSPCLLYMSSCLCYRSKGFLPAGKAPAPEWGGVAPVWWSLMRSHNQQPLHALLRGGGQINGDRIFEVHCAGNGAACRLAPARGVHCSCRLACISRAVADVQQLRACCARRCRRQQSRGGRRAVTAQSVSRHHLRR